MTTDPEEFLATKYHEAGHAVWNVLLADRLGYDGRVINNIEILPDGGGWFRPTEAWCAAWQDATDMNEWLEDRGVACLMGPAAKARFLGVQTDIYSDELGAGGDLEIVDELAELVRERVDWGERWMPDYAELEFRYVIERIAEATVADPRVWRAISALARSLKVGVNDGEEAAKIVMRALNPPTALCEDDAPDLPLLFWRAA
jgi:hypothetical protein